MWLVWGMYVHTQWEDIFHLKLSRIKEHCMLLEASSCLCGIYSQCLQARCRSEYCPPVNTAPPPPPPGIFLWWILPPRTLFTSEYWPQWWIMSPTLMSAVWSGSAALSCQQSAWNDGGFGRYFSTGSYPEGYTKNDKKSLHACRKVASNFKVTQLHLASSGASLHAITGV